jgi:hypothetical protein
MEIQHMSKKKTNDIIADYGEYLEIDISTPKFPNATMKVDSAMWRKFSIEVDRRVFPFSTSGMQIPYARFKLNGMALSFHRYVLNGFKQLDHINRDPLDNRIANIRPCTSSQNNINRTFPNISGCTGLVRTGKNKWVARINYDGVRVHLGTFGTFKEAAVARKNAEVRFHHA